jgi:HSP20 family molecular chaperone IbpA
MTNPLDKLLGRDKKDDEHDGLKDMFAEARKRRGVTPEQYTSDDFPHSRNDLDDITSFFANHPFFGGRSMNAGVVVESPASSLFENLISHSQSTSYQIHQDGKEVTIEVDLPGVSAKELKVEVLQNIQSCVVQWSGQRKRRNEHNDARASGYQTSSSMSSSSFNNRLRLGPQVECDNLTANLSNGILTMKAPMKEVQETANVRSVPVTEHQLN